MSETLLTPDLRRILSNLARRLGILERRISGSAATSTGTPSNGEIIFSYSGLLTALESPPAKLRYSGFLAVLAVGLLISGSTSTTLEVKKNGMVIATVVIPGGTSDYIAEIGVRVAAEDRISVNIAAAGTGAFGMAATARFT